MPEEPLAYLYVIGAIIVLPTLAGVVLLVRSTMPRAPSSTNVPAPPRFREPSRKATPRPISRVAMDRAQRK